uniref:Uncharacterized protein n=1 Tax=Elaeophora elaphi TaxID=1147741 RepID=A0A0R3RKJ6_9BILA
MTATPHFVFAAMTKLHHAATATNLHPTSTSVSPKEVSMSPPAQQDRHSGLCAEQPVPELKTASTLTCRSPSSIGNDHVAPPVASKLLSPKSTYDMMTSDCCSSGDSYRSSSSSTAAYINNVKRRRKPDGQLYLSFLQNTSSSIHDDEFSLNEI